MNEWMNGWCVCVCVCVYVIYYIYVFFYNARSLSSYCLIIHFGILFRLLGDNYIRFVQVYYKFYIFTFIYIYLYTVINII